MVKETVTRTFDALADPRRCQVIELLGRSPRSAGQLARDTDMSPSAMSRHLRVLLELGLITDARHPHDARVRMFQLRPDPLSDCGAWLDQVQAHWRDNLASFKAYVESEPAR